MNEKENGKVKKKWKKLMNNLAESIKSCTFAHALQNIKNVEIR